MPPPLHRRALLAALLLLALVARAPSSLADSVKPRVHVVALGLFGEQDLFRREATAAATLLAQHFGHSGQLIVRANTSSRSGAGLNDVRDTLQGLASAIDRQSDVLVLFLTSHGNQNGLAIVNRGSNRPAFLTPDSLAATLKATGIRHRVVIISACYSGVFLENLADDETLVITAADARHSSFGCSDDNKGDYTYFGQAFFAESLKPGLSLDQVFKSAKSRIADRESAENLTGSNPQMKGGATVLAKLARQP